MFLTENYFSPIWFWSSYNRVSRNTHHLRIVTRAA
jgi:hypothetical protein